ncbi:MAG: hypothetical protein WCP97_06535 [bacterium]
MIIGISVLLVILVLIYLLYRKLFVITASVLNLLFFFFLAAALLSLFLPAVFDRGGELITEKTDIIATIRNIDGATTAVTEVPQKLTDTLRSFFTPPQNNLNTTAKKAGYLESTLYPKIIGLVAFLLRWFTLIVSIVFMVLIIYFRYTFAGFSDIDKLEKKVARLESQLAQLSIAAAPIQPQVMQQNSTPPVV